MKFTPKDLVQNYTIMLDQIEKAKHNDIEARNLVMESQLGIVYNTAASFNRPDLFEDLVQEGILAIPRAIGKYDPKKGKFTTYAHRWIWHAMNMYVYNNIACLHIPRNITQDSSFSIKSTVVEDHHTDIVSYRNDLVRPCTNSYEVVSHRKQLTHNISHMSDSLLCTKVINAIKRRDPKRYTMILRLFGFWGEPQTLDTIAKSFNISRERVRQHKNRMLKGLDKVLCITREDVYST